MRIERPLRLHGQALAVGQARRRSGAAARPTTSARASVLHQAKRRSIFAAQMTSLSVTPPASCVENVTTHLP